MGFESPGWGSQCCPWEKGRCDGCGKTSDAHTTVAQSKGMLTMMWGNFRVVMFTQGNHAHQAYNAALQDLFE